MSKEVKISGSRLLLAALVSAVVLTGVMFAANAGILQGGQQVRQAAADSTPAATIENKNQTVDLDGVTLSFDVQPSHVHASDKTTLNFKVSDTKSGAPLSHVDWVIVIKNPTGDEVYKTSTAHSHMGVENFSYTFLEPGQNTVHIEVASLGPKMMGMDVPKEAQTRIFASGDPMKSPEVDQTFFFGTRSHDFTVNVASQGGIKTVTSDMGKKVTLELSTSPRNVIAGQPTTLILDVKDATTGMHIMHPDALITIRQGGFLQSASAPAGSPMMPMSGAYHGHTGQIAVTTVFPTPGIYNIKIDINSLPVSDVKFGHVSTQFRVLVSEGLQDATAPAASAGTHAAHNQVSITGQAAPYFSPSNITIKAGDSVTFKNVDFVVHTVTSTSVTGNGVPTPDGLFDTGLLGNGEEKQMTFDKPGTYSYFCQVHPQMRGTVTVTR